LKPRSDTDCWFKLRVGGTADPQHFTSYDNSDTQEFFQDHNHKAYPMAVQESDDTVILCAFVYSGPFSNPKDFEECLCKAIPNKEMKFGCRTMKTKEIPEPKNIKDYILKPNIMIHLEVERTQAKEMKAILYHLFNKRDSKRPGGYNFRVLPDKSQLRTGSRGERDRINMLHKHQANVQLLSVFKSSDLQEMDSVQTIQGKTYTLRQALLDIPFPLFS
jgi:hypothetical protein